MAQQRESGDYNSNICLYNKSIDNLQKSQQHFMIYCNANIAILMATYNGGKFLREQIDSLFAQTYQDWHLYVHDDGSNDNTVDIVQEYIENYPNKITLMDYPPQGGACKNFLSMLEMVDAPYYMFCDQDDVWLSKKIKLEWEIITDEEIKNPQKPIIVNTDLMVVDAKLIETNPSFWKYSGIYPQFAKEFKDYSALNVATGCTMLLNNSAKKCIKPYCDKTLMHDSWILFSVLSHKGILKSIHEATVLYRQHENNTLGACNVNERTITNKLMNLRYVLRQNVLHYREMNAIQKVSIFSFILAKLRYWGFIINYKQK